MAMTAETLQEVGIRDLSNATSDCVNRVFYRGDVIYVTKNGRRVAALVPLEVVEAAELAELAAPARA